MPQTRALTTDALQDRCDGAGGDAFEACSALIASGREQTADLAADYVQRGNVLFARGQFDTAISDYSQAIGLTPDIGAPWFDRGTAYARVCKLDAAVADFSRALTLVPDQPEVLIARAQAYGAMKQPQAALADLARYLARAPNDAAALTALGTVEDNAGRFDLAVQAYTRVLAAHGDYADAYFNRALAYAHAGRTKEGRADIDTYVRMRPDDAEGYLARAAAFEKDAPDAAGADMARAAALHQPVRKACGA
jgi:tetratricopeptide (TPR) repeat protein